MWRWDEETTARRLEDSSAEEPFEIPACCLLDNDNNG